MSDQELNVHDSRWEELPLGDEYPGLAVSWDRLSNGQFSILNTEMGTVEHGGVGHAKSVEEAREMAVDFLDAGGEPDAEMTSGPEAQVPAPGWKPARPAEKLRMYVGVARGLDINGMLERLFDDNDVLIIEKGA